MRNLIVGIVAAATLTACSSAGGDSPGAEPRDPNVVYRVDPETEEVLGEMPIQARITVGEGFGSVAVDERNAWVLSTLDQKVSQIDVTTNTVTDRVDLEGGSDPGGLTVASGDAWVTDPSYDRVRRIDGETGIVMSTVASKKLPIGIVESNGDLWVANHHGAKTTSVWRVDGKTNKVVARIPVGETTSLGPQWMAAGAGSVWVGAPNVGGIVRINPQTNAVEATIPVPDGGVCGQLIADDTAVWVASGGCGNGALTRIDPNTNEVVTQIDSPLWSAVFGGTLGYGSLWLSTDGGPVEIDPATNEIVSRLVLEGDETFGGDMFASPDSLWVHNGMSNTVVRIDPPTEG